MKNIVVVGSLNQDISISVRRLPVEGETVLARAVRKGIGGKGANQAIAASRLGGEVSMIGFVGNDSAGSEMLEAVKGGGVDCSGIGISDRERTGKAYITVDDAGRNTIVVDSGANSCVTPEFLETLLHDRIDANTIVLMQMEIPRESLLYGIEYAKKRDAFVILNPAPAAKLPREVYSGIDILTPNETELAILSSAAGKDIAAMSTDLVKNGTACVVVTLGAEGAGIILNGTGVRRVQAPSVNAVDTTGAGDCFNGALAAALAQGYRLDDAVLFAVRAASFSVSSFGTITSYPDESQMEMTFGGNA